MIGILGVGMILKSALVKWGVDVFIYCLTVLIILFNCTLFFINPKFIKRSVLWCTIFLFCGLLSLSYSLLNGLAQVSLPGFALAYLYFIFWLITFSTLSKGSENILFNKYVKIQLYLAVVTSALAIYQFFFDTTIFNLCVYKYYMKAEEYAQYGITKRATALIGSPQNLGIYLALMCQSVFLVDFKLYKKVFLYVLFFWGGLLSGSGTFIGVTLIFLFIYSFKKRSLALKFLRTFIVLVVIVLIFANFGSETPLIHDSPVDLGTDLRYGNRLDSYNLKAVFGVDSLMEILLGRGLGLSDQGVDRFLDYSGAVLFNSESYLLKLFYEQGALAFVMFMLLYGKAMYSAYKSTYKHAYVLFAILLSMLPNLLFTPSFAGFTMSFMLWPYIFFSLILSDQKEKRAILEVFAQ